jgi:hypothetical protein
MLLHLAGPLADEAHGARQVFRTDDDDRDDGDRHQLDQPMSNMAEVLPTRTQSGARDEAAPDAASADLGLLVGNGLALDRLRRLSSSSEAPS